MFFLQLLCDLSRTHAAIGHIKDTFDHQRSDRVHNQGLLISGHTIVTKRNASAASLAIGHARIEDGFDLVAGISCVPFVHDVEERSEVIIRSVLTINAVVDRNEVDFFLREQYLGIEPYLQVVTTKSAHILDDDHTDIPGMNLSQQLLKAWAIKVSAGITVIREVTNIGEAISRCVIFEIFLLRWNLSRGFSAKHNVSENSVQNICRAVSPQRMRIIGSMVFFYL